MDFSLTFRRTEAQFDDVQKASLLENASAGVSPVPWLLIAATTAAILVGIIAALIVRNLPAEMWRYAIAASLCSATAAIVIFVVARPAFGATKKTGPSELGSFLTGWQVQTSPEGVLEKGNGWQRAYTWQSLLAASALDTGFLLFHDTSDGIFIPYTAFRNDAHRQAFTALLRERVADVRCP